MKKTLILLLAVIFAIPGYSQEKPAVAAEKNVIKVNTLALVLGTGSVFYERKLSDVASAQMGLAFLSYKWSSTKFSGIVLTPEVRIYLKKRAIDGVYFAPYLRYQNYSLKDTESDSKGTLSSMGGGVALGRQWITKSGFTMDLFFGGHYSSASVTVNSGTDTFDSGAVTGFKVRIGFALGFAF